MVHDSLDRFLEIVVQLLRRLEGKQIQLTRGPSPLPLRVSQPILRPPPPPPVKTPIVPILRRFLR